MNATIHFKTHMYTWNGEQYSKNFDEKIILNIFDKAVCSHIFPARNGAVGDKFGE